jgi:hypothetical protein
VWALSDGQQYVIELPVLDASDSFVLRSDLQGNGWVLISPGSLSLVAVAVPSPPPPPPLVLDGEFVRAL